MSPFEVYMKKLLALKKPSKDKENELKIYMDEMYKLSQEMQKHIKIYLKVHEALFINDQKLYPSLFVAIEPPHIITLKVITEIYNVFGEKFSDLCIKITPQQVKDVLIEDFGENLVKFNSIIYIEIYLNEWSNIEDCLDLYLNSSNTTLLKLFNKLANKNNKIIPEIQNGENHIQYLNRIKTLNF
jgi:hypothetical protein